eukprot:TRINITY_DN1920_c2_g1_i1.p1 TRINITY_DN1920_c2_g1~~TRINITY_DN1920_c2_g1_i1.p1  ORF type:complete len:493 (-),score=96.60 TRINITY_DN1920_c2_g1_i1:70-1548(-)
MIAPRSHSRVVFPLFLLFSFFIVSLFAKICPGMEDYTVSLPPSLSPLDSHYRFLYRPWSNTGLGHTIEIYNLALKLARHNNLTLVHTPLQLGHRMSATLSPEEYFGFGVGQLLRNDLNDMPAPVTSVSASTTTQETATHLSSSSSSSQNRRRITTLPFPTSEMHFVSHQNRAPSLFHEYVQTHPEENVLFEIPSPMLMADQDADFSSTGAWFRSQYENARLKNVRRDSRIRILMDPTQINIAVHIRRGDSTRMMLPQHSLSDQYYVQIINTVLDSIRGWERSNSSNDSAESNGDSDNANDSDDRTVSPPVRVHIFSDGNRDLSSAHEHDASLHYVNELGEASNFTAQIRCHDCVRWHFDADAITTFHHMVVSDVLVGGVSMFGNVAAIVSRNVKIMATTNRSYRTIPNIIAATATATTTTTNDNDNNGHASVVPISHSEMRRFERLWKSYSACVAPKRAWYWHRRQQQQHSHPSSSNTQQQKQPHPNLKNEL